ncbi:MAG: hypothetical protein QF631_00420 [Arenicellales bacterium]|nr:hypothetical protein [Arenicellales bacterium]
MNIDTQDKLSAQINQARGVLAALLADTCDLKCGSTCLPRCRTTRYGP